MSKKSLTVRRERVRSLKFETLENRELLAVDLAFASVPETPGAPLENESAPEWCSLTSTGLNPSAIEQELLERINLFRTDPQGELGRVFSTATNDSLVARNSLVNAALSLTSYPIDSLDVFLNEMRSIQASAPLAFSPSLESAAAAHSSYMKARNDISHQCVGEDPLEKRVEKAGFEPGLNESGAISVSENIGGSFVERDGWSVASYIEAAFVVDWGVPEHSHRDSLANAAYSEIGISVQQTTKSVGPYLVTCDLGTSVEGARSDGAYLLGVIFDDSDGDRFYDVGEGLASASIRVERIGSNEFVTFSSWTSGGYQIFLANGEYKVSVSFDDFSTSISKMATINGGVKSKLDFITSDISAAIPVIDLNGDSEGINWSVAYEEGSGNPLDIFTSGSLTITDEDSAYLYGAKIYFDSRPDGIKETLDLSVAGTNLSASFEQSSGFITISGEGSIEDYEAVIASLAYFNESDLCELTDRSILFSVYDGTSWSETAALNVSIKPTNLPQMTVRELFVYEGDEGSKIAEFEIELSSPARLDVSFNFNVAPGGSAVEGEQFVVSKGDPITIAKGETRAVIECYVVGNYDPLKPEGLRRLEDGYENPFTDFFLEIVDLENAYLTNEDSLVKGVIYDDDSPIVLGETSGYAYRAPLSTDSSKRRYVFKLTPESSGIFTWSADALGLPAGASVKVREAGLESAPIAISKTTDSGANVQWFADPSVEYWITVESTVDLNAVIAKLLTFDEENFALVDPLFDGDDEGLLRLMWTEDGLQLAADDFSWALTGELAREPSFKTERDNLLFEMNVSPFSNGSASFEEDSLKFDFNDESIVTIRGGGNYSFVGADENENITFIGTNENDYLYYSNGSGYFARSDGKQYAFRGVNSVSIDGNGGFDSAYIEDTPENDRLETTNDSLALLGGGFSLSVLRFSDASVFFNQGGSDTFCANDSGDDVSVSLSKNSALITGSFDIVKTDLEESSGETENNASYFRSVSGFQNLIVAPKESIGAVQICGDHSVDVSYNASVGTLSSVNRRSRAAFSISSVQNLTIVDIYPTQYDFLTLDLPAAYETREENDLLVITDLETNWSLTIPIGKELPAKNDVGDPSEQTVVSGALFDATNALDEDEALAPSLIDASFAQMGAFDFAEVDVFKLARSLKKGVRTPLRETNWRAR